MPQGNDFLLQLGQLKKASVDQLSISFRNLPKSNYLDGSYRLRRYSHFLYSADFLETLPVKPFQQNQEINQFQGNVEREYLPIESSVIKSRAFVEMFASFKDMANIADKTPIEVHQIRILADTNKDVEVAPEGVHQDGFDHLAVFVIERNNIQGGDICVHTNKHQAPFFKHQFDNGEFVVLNDKKFWHSAQSLKAANDDTAYMDVFVLTA